MLLLLSLSQITVSISILFVWLFRFQNVKRDFQSFGLSNLTRDLVGITKVVLSISLLFSLLFTQILLPTTILLSLFMLVAQYFHLSINNSFYKKAPSLILLVLLIFIIYMNL